MKFPESILIKLVIWFTTLLVIIVSFLVESIYVLFGYFFFYIIYFLLRKYINNDEERLFLLVYNLNVIAVIVLYYIYLERYGLPYFIGGSDDLAFEQFGDLVASKLNIFQYSGIRKLSPELKSHNSIGYVYLINLLYRVGNVLGGFHTLIPRVLNAMLLSFIAIISYRIAYNHLRIWDDTSFNIGLASGLLPILVYNGAHTFREVSIAVLILFIIYLWNEFSYKQFRKNYLFIIISVICIIILYELRSFVAIGIDL